ncbi:hypothetical protein BG011_001583 [Mortierella polycephala]|uniref:Uncharacterized protein n=1 Tax=Mortierella polycephala TaxID=41804 RepID=A0A9P6TUQ6_9FUNG|nr:hypothetical protein BG011_001583 [Mortierella polycephala]
MSGPKFLTAEGMILAASLIQDAKYGAGASALLKSSAAVVDDSFDISLSAGTPVDDDVAHNVVEGIEVADGTAELSIMTQDSDESGGLYRVN